MKSKSDAEILCHISELIVEIIADGHSRGRTVFVFGNGGSASAASRIALDWSKGTAAPGKGGLKILSLSDNGALITTRSGYFKFAELILFVSFRLSDPATYDPI